MNREKELVLGMLAELEAFRKRIESGEVQEGSSDWTIRMCQAHIAKGYFETRIEWSEELKAMVQTV
ncbi:hypothetical protein [Paenibacillus sp. FSL W8-1287]|uniref:hypothetical protein n=1 Tax=Paenibacillus sp. FSL W8-1287 TaxID=2954653 RepID=UPI0030CA924F